MFWHKTVSVGYIQITEIIFAATVYARRIGRLLIIYKLMLLVISNRTEFYLFMEV